MVSKTKGRVHKCNAALTVHLLNRLWDDPSCPKLNTVRRNLFGYYESKETCQLLDKQVSDMAEKSQQEWNFDFINESPKIGRYLWQKVQSCDVPFWYATVGRKALKDLWRQKEISCKNSTKRNTEMKLPKCKVNSVKKDEKKPKLVQTTMKDYTRVKKRRSSCRLRLKQLQLFSHRLRKHHIM